MISVDASYSDEDEVTNGSGVGVLLGVLLVLLITSIIPIAIVIYVLRSLGTIVEGLRSINFDVHLAGRLGSGSDVLGLDDDRSQDHDFGCRLTLLVDDEHAALLEGVDRRLEAELPHEVAGWPTRFATSWDSRTRHKVDLHTVHDFIASRLGFDLRSPLSSAEWLCITGQSVLEVTGGPVFHNTTSTYAKVAAALEW